MKRPVGNVVPEQPSVGEIGTPADERRQQNFLDASMHRTCVPTVHYLAQLEYSSLRATGKAGDEIDAIETDESAIPLMESTHAREKRGVGRRKEQEIVAESRGALRQDDFDLQKKLHTRLITQLLSHIQFIADHFCAIDDDEQVGNGRKRDSYRLGSSALVCLGIQRLVLCGYGNRSSVSYPVWLFQHWYSVHHPASAYIIRHRSAISHTGGVEASGSGYSRLIAP